MRVDGRVCRLPGATPLAALAALRLPLRVTAGGSCSDSAFFVTTIGRRANAGRNGWTYKVGRRAGTTSAASPSGSFGNGRRLGGGEVAVRPVPLGRHPVIVVAEHRVDRYSRSTQGPQQRGDRLDTPRGVVHEVPGEQHEGGLRRDGPRDGSADCRAVVHKEPDLKVGQDDDLSPPPALRQTRYRPVDGVGDEAVGLEHPLQQERQKQKGKEQGGGHQGLTLRRARKGRPGG